MSTDAEAADRGPLSIDDAVALLDKQDEAAAQAQETPAAPTEGAPSQDSEAAQAEDTTGAETPTGETTEADQDAQAEGDEPQPQPIDPPKFWDAAKRELFSTLPREAQEYILATEGERNSSTSKKLEEIAAQRKVVDAELAKYQGFNTALEQLIPQARDTFKSRWANVDWNAVVDQYGADQAFKLKQQFEHEQGQMQQLEAAKQIAEQEELRRFTQSETAKLTEVAPDLVDAKQGAQRRTDLGKFLVARGFTPDRIQWMSAEEASIAYDAMRWRNAQTQAKTLAKAPQQPAPAKRTPAKPAAAQAPRSTQQQRIDTLSRKRSLSIDEAVELLNLKGNEAA